MKTLLSASLVLVQMNHKEDLQVIGKDFLKESFAQRGGRIAINLEIALRRKHSLPFIPIQVLGGHFDPESEISQEI